MKSFDRGMGGAPTRASIMPKTAEGRKRFPVATGVLDYFPDALAAIAEVSLAGNDQHNPGKSLHWDRSKSADEADAMIRHFLERGNRDIDGIRHTAKMAWRALALLQKELEAEVPQVMPPDALEDAVARFDAHDRQRLGRSDQDYRRELARAVERGDIDIIFVPEPQGGAPDAGPGQGGGF